MKHAVLICSLLLAVLTGYGQAQLSSSVVSSGGGYFEGQEISLSWTLGELAVGTFHGDNVILTQGFQQLFDVEVGMAENEGSWSISTYPNPVGDALRIRFDIPVPGPYMLEVLDVTGRLIWQETHDHIKAGDIVHLNTAGYQPGIYLLKVYDLHKKQVQVSSLRKI